jgi:hypothetical protein
MILGFIRKRLSNAIDWRVVKEFDREREVILSLHDVVEQTGIQLTDRVKTLEKSIVVLSDRIRELETKLH